MLIRRGGRIDAPAVFAVHDAAFSSSDDEPAPEARLVEELQASGDVVSELSLVADIGEQVVGHVVCSRAHIGEHPSLGLGPLGVLPRFQRGGVGSALMHAVLGAADALDFPAVVLLGDPHYYRRFGFQLAQPLGVLPPDPDWTPHFQIRLLSAWTGRTRGMFGYAAAFDHL